jgi:integrase
MRLYKIGSERAHLSSSRKSIALHKKRFSPVGVCLRQKINDREYSGFSQKCPVCGAPPWHKCLGITGAVSPICHIKRELRSAESFRAKVRQVAGYETTWRIYLGPRLQKITLRDFRTVDAANLLVEIHRQHNVGRTMIQHCKRRLSGLFTLARNQGAFDTPNPVQGAMLPKKAAAPSKTHAATPDEVMTILDTFEKANEWKARAAVGLMFFAGLRPGEARGVRWEDYDGKRLAIRQSVWHTHTTSPKTEEAASPVPVIDTLADILAKVREVDGNPTRGPILRGPSGKPLNLDNLSKRVVTPLLNAAGVKWNGWYSLRRGVATTLAGLTHDGMASKGLLRHTNLATTTRHYVKDVPENTLSAMNKLETLFNECATPGPERVH